MMAAGEARAVWQRTVSRYLVQEDAKRAPKFTSSHSSSSSSSTKHVQEDSVSSPPVVHPQNQSPFMPLNIPQLLDHHPHHEQFEQHKKTTIRKRQRRKERGAYKKKKKHTHTQQNTN